MAIEDLPSMAIFTVCIHITFTGDYCIRNSSHKTKKLLNLKNFKERK